CYQDSWGWIPREMYEEVPEFLPPSPVRDMVLKYRTPLDDFETTIRERGTPMQKFQYFFRTTQLRDQYLPIVQEQFPQFEISKSSPLNIEINGSGTNKGITMKALCGMLQIPMEKTAAFGDDINDISFLTAAGKGIAMENAVEAVKRIADDVTGNNNDGGFGIGCRDLLGI
ncbi:MAG: HAD hydrolase family protein, partial [Oscillospiraceae bacterium]|nr:HAD hydrolase family protein [Oscillospiraceae bacterium]